LPFQSPVCPFRVRFALSHQALGGKPEAKLRLYVGGTVKARLDRTLPLPSVSGAWRNERIESSIASTLLLWEERGTVKLRLDRTPNVEMEHRLHLVLAWVEER